MHAKTANAPWETLKQAPFWRSAGTVVGYGLSAPGHPPVLAPFSPQARPGLEGVEPSPNGPSALREAPAKDANQSRAYRPASPASRQPPLRLRSGPTLKSAAQHESMTAGPGWTGTLPTAQSRRRNRILAHCCFFAGSHVNGRFNGTCGVLPVPTHRARERALSPPPTAEGGPQPADGACPVFCFLADSASRGRSVLSRRKRLARSLALCLFPVAGSCPARFQRRDVRLPLSRVSLHISHAWQMQRHSPHIPATAHGNSPLVPGRGVRDRSTPGGYQQWKTDHVFRTLCSGAGAVTGSAWAKNSTAGRGFAVWPRPARLGPVRELGPVGASFDGAQAPPLGKRMHNAHHRSASTGKAFVACYWLAPAAEALLPFAQPSRPPG